MVSIRFLGTAAIFFCTAIGLSGCFDGGGISGSPQ
jgi:hypothetical protein